jgi:transposase
MVSLAYSEVLKDSPNPYNLRLMLVEWAQRDGIKAAASQFSCSRNTARKWLRRYKEKGLNGLNNYSRRPHSSPNLIPAKEEAEIIRLRKLLKHISASRMRREFGINRSPRAIYRVLRKDNKTKPRRWQKPKTKNDLREVKSKLRVFEKIQVDTKELKDIPNYYRYLSSHKLPKYEFTARDVKSGALFVCPAYTKECTNAAVFAAYLLEHLRRFGIDVSKTIIQTDNGTEYCGNWRAGSSSPFNYIVEKVYNAVHERIPPSAPTFNSDVETAHARIEEELYDIEEFESLWITLSKIFTYGVYFNLIRQNTYKKMKTPLNIIEEDLGPVDPNLLALMPIVLDDHFDLYEQAIAREGGHHVPQLPNRL